MTRLEEIERRVQATPGPWAVEYSYGWHAKDSPGCKDTCGKGQTPFLPPRMEKGEEIHAWRRHVDDIAAPEDPHLVCWGHDDGDYGGIDEATADFAAHARADVPWLLAEVRRLRAGLAEMAADTHECTHALTAEELLDGETP